MVVQYCNYFIVCLINNSKIKLSYNMTKNFITILLKIDQLLQYCDYRELFSDNMVIYCNFIRRIVVQYVRMSQYD